ncbi:sensor histidine kinase [Nonomuraea sp. SYSU D8015]|uniref:sensor histidine kinase n=1 Tax=Nonomuraea sp. SYSU D8015 TaxID=2593644 RepID=UPI0016615AE5|nr:histidine kinase [Nonomuraea sp. SYSU D8015]
MAALVASAFVLIGLGAAGMGPGWVWPASAAYARAALRGRLAWAVGVGVLCLVTGSALGARLPAGEALWLGLLLAGALAYRAHARLRQESSARRRAAERVALAREVHDVIAHTLAVLGVQLTVAEDAFDDAPAEARQALRTAQRVRGEAVAELRSLIGALRYDGDPDGRLAALLDQVRASGLRVTLHRTGRPPAAVPDPVSWTIYRVVQEALTNTVKHGQARSAEVILHYRPAEMRLTVTDDGQSGHGCTDSGAPAGDDRPGGHVHVHEDRAVGGSAGGDHACDDSGRHTTGGDRLTGRATCGDGPGHGIAGMRERVASLGGALTAGPAGRGFAVEAVIPFTGPAAQRSDRPSGAAGRPHADRPSGAAGRPHADPPSAAAGRQHANRPSAAAGQPHADAPPRSTQPSASGGPAARSAP